MHHTVHRARFIFLLIILFFTSTVKGQFTINEPLTGSSITGITLGGKARLTGTGQSGADPIGQGYLRLTEDANNQVGWAYINQSFTPDMGAIIDFEFLSWGNSSSKADGFSVFLFDASYDINNSGPKKFAIGADGGSLGYAQKTGVAGLTGGYVGIGIDEFGNFIISSEGKNGGIGGSNLLPDAIAIRGPSSNYAYIGGTHSGVTGSPMKGVSVDYNTTTSIRPTSAQFYRRVQILLEPVSGAGFKISIKLKTSPTGDFVTIIPSINSSLLANPPARLRVGFAGSTGGSKNVHELRNLFATTSNNLSVTKLGPSGVDNQTTFSYTIDVQNGSGTDANNTIVRDTLPPSFSLVNSSFSSSNAQNAGVVTANGNILELRATTLKANSSGTFTLTGKLNETSGTLSQITNLARVYSPTGFIDLDPTNDVSKITTIIRRPDLSIAKTHSGSFVRGGSYNFTIKVNNNSSANGSTANQVQVTDVLPAGLTPQGSTYASNGWAVTVNDQTVTAVRSDALTPGSTYPDLVIPIKVDQTAASSLSNTASVSVAGETTTSNNSSTDVVQVISQTDISVEISDNSTSYTPGGTGSYVITVRNVGLTNAGNISLSNTLPLGVTINGAVTGSATGGSIGTISGPIGGNKIAITGASLQVGTGNTLVFTVPVSYAVSLTTDPLVNTVTVAEASEPANAVGNNTANDSDTRNGQSDLNLEQITPNVSSMKRCDNAELTFQIRNNGPVNAISGLNVQFPLPDGLTFDSATQGGSYNSSTGIVTINSTANLPVGSIVSLVLKAIVKPDAPVSIPSVEATVAPNSPNVDAIPANNKRNTPSISIGSSPSGILSGTQTVCSGTTALLTLNLTGNPPWNIVYSDGTTDFSINNINNASYSFSVSPTATTTYTLKSVDDGTTDCGYNVTGNAVVTITPAIGNNTITATSSLNICYGSNPSLINGSIPTGGSGGYSYQWQSSLDGTNWSNITTAGQNANYDPPVLPQSAYYRRTITSGACINPLASNAIRFAVSPIPLLTIVSVPSILEGNSGTTVANFQIELSQSVSCDVSVNYATSNVTALVGEDYVGTSGVLTIPAGSTSATIPVTVNGDIKFEPDETFTLTLSNPVNTTINTTTATGTIRNDDAIPTVSINPASQSLSEGTGAGSTTAALTVTLSNPSAQTITVDYSTSASTATSGVDYTSVSNITLTFAPGETSKNISIAITRDNIKESDEQFSVVLSNINNATAGSLTGQVTITDDDAVPTISISAASVSEGNTGTTALTFTATLGNPSASAVSFNYATANGTASTADNDYVAIASGTLSFAAGELSKTITVFVNGDVKFEANETFSLQLSNAVNATLGQTSVTGTITNDDQVPHLTASAFSVKEGNSGITSLTIKARLTNPSSQTISWNGSSKDGTATAADNDYHVFVNIPFTLPPGVTAKDTTLFVIGDTKFEEDETWFVTLSDAQNVVLDIVDVPLTIVNDDAQPVVNVASLSQNEGNSGATNYDFHVVLDHASYQQVEVDVATANGTATTADNDYQASSSHVVFAPGETDKVFTVVVNGDTKREADETFTLTLSNPVNTTINTTTATGTIRNDDALPTVSINPASQSVSEGTGAGTTTVNLTVTLSNPSAQTITVDYSTAAGTATSGADYTSVFNLTLTFAPGETSKNISIAITRDNIKESDEQFSVVLSNINNATAGSLTGQVTITDDDAVPTISISAASVSEGNTGTTVLTFTATLGNPSASAVSFNYATANGTASTADNDYVAITSGTLSFAAGELSKTITVFVNGDVKYEANEIFSLQLSNAANATLGQTSVTGTITNDDQVPHLTASAFSVKEGNSGLTSLTIKARLSNPSDQTISWNGSSKDGTATAADNDYGVFVNIPFTLPPGVTAKDTTLFVIGDTKFEADETWFVTLSDAQNVVLDIVDVPLTIVNDDAQPVVSLASLSQNEGNSGATNYDFHVVLDHASYQQVEVDVATANGTATTADNDYQTSSAHVVFAPGETDKVFTVVVNGDTKREADEAFTVTLSNPINATINTTTATGTIRNDDAIPTVSISPASQSLREGTGAGSTTTALTVTLSNPSAQTITVDYSTSAGTATSGVDYTSVSNITLTFAPGETSKNISITITRDNIKESDEQFSVVLSNINNATAGSLTGQVTITDDDAVPTISISAASVSEGNTGTTALTFTATLSNPSASAVSFNYATANGTASTADNDYVAITSGTLSFAAGELSKTITVFVNGDVKFEANETFSLQLSNAVNATLGQTSVTGTITNDDQEPHLTASAFSVKEGNSGITSLTIKARLSNPSDQTISWNGSSKDGTATAADNDYHVFANIPFTMPPGVTAKDTTLFVIGDTKFEPDEVWYVTLSDAQNVVLDIVDVPLTIVNDDAQPVVSLASLSQNEGNSGATNYDFHVVLDHASYQQVEVDLATANGTATTGDNDYQANTVHVVFAPGETDKVFTVVINGDTKREPDETFTLTLSNPVNSTINTTTATGTIRNDDAIPTVSISPTSQSVSEGTGAGSTTVNLTVMLSNSSAQTITVDYSTSAGTATSGVDYTSVSNITLTFAPGETSKNISITITRDNIKESDEQFSVVLSNINNATAGNLTGQVTITDDDAVPTISVAAASVNEGNTGTTALTFTATLGNPSASAVSFNYATANGTASTADNDYVTIASGTLSFAAGELSKTITVFVNGDVKFEADETFTLQLSNATNATLGQTSVTGTITNDDQVPHLTTSAFSVKEGNSGITSLTIKARLSNPSDQTISWNGSSKDGTATAADNDYHVFVNIPFTLPPGVTAKDTTLFVIGDTKFETDETWFVTLSDAQNVVLDIVDVPLTIVNDDAQPVVSLVSLSQNEGNSGATNYDFHVVLDHASYQQVEVDVATANGTATTADNDYQAGSAHVVFAPGETDKVFTVVVNGDTKREPDETFTLTLSNPVNTTINTTTATGTIRNDDAIPTVSISPASQSLSEGTGAGSTTAALTVTLSNPSAQTITVDYSTSAGTATSGADYTSVSNLTLTFAPGETSKNISIAITRDDIKESDEQFSVVLSNINNATAGNLTGQVTITDDDAVPTISVAAASVNEGNTGTTALTFTATLGNPSASAVSFNYATANGTASTADNDYVAITSGTLSFAAGELSKTITVFVNGDVKFEANETFSLQLSNAVNATLGQTSVTGTITNDDQAPHLTASAFSVKEGNSGITLLTIKARLSNPTDQTVSWNGSSKDGTATAADNDYGVFVNIPFTLPPGVTAKDTTLFVIGDTKFETDETWFVTLSDAQNVVLDIVDVPLTIVNDDAQPVVSLASLSQNEGNSGATNYDFHVVLDHASYQQVEVDVATANGTATTADNDYQAGNAHVVFAPGETDKVFTVVVNGDTKDESDETFNISLTNPINASAPATFIQNTIVNDDAQPVATIADVSMIEGNAGQQTLMIFTVQLSNTSDKVISMNFSTTDGTAVSTGAEKDYQAVIGRLQIPPNTLTGTIAIPINGDLTFENDETFSLIVNNPTAVDFPQNAASVIAVGTILNDDGIPSASISNVSANEGNAGTNNFNFLVTLSNPSTQTITIDYATQNGTALTTDNDYVSQSGTLTFAAGELSKLVSIQVNGDLKFESDENFTVNLSNASNANIITPQGTATIVNDDNLPIISIVNSASALEANGKIDFAVNLSNPTDKDISLVYSVTDGTATVADNDYVGGSNLIVLIPAGSTTATLAVPVNDDTKNENDETFTVTLVSADNATLSASAISIGTILDDDQRSIISMANVAVNESSGSAVVTLTLDKVSGKDIQVNYATSNVTARSPNDFTAVSSTLTIPAGTASIQISIPIIDDALNENDETFRFNLNGPVNAILSTTSVVVTIIDNDALPTLSFGGNVSLLEGNTGVTDFVFTVQLSAVSGRDISFAYQTNDVTANAPFDYVTSSGIITIPAGSTQASITIAVNGDLSNEADDTFSVSIANPVNVSLGSVAVATGTIVNDDALPTLSISDASVVEGNTGTTLITFDVSLSAPSGRPITLTYSTSNGTATGGSDFIAVNNAQLVIPAGTLHAKVTIEVIGDIITEGDETFTVKITSADFADLVSPGAKPVGTGTIIGDDGQPILTVNDITVDENAGTATFTVALGGNPTSQDVTVDYAITNGTAEVNSDYNASNLLTGSLTFPTGGTLTQTVTVNIVDDTIDEDDETFLLTLSNANGAVISRVGGVCTIIDNDDPPLVSINNISQAEGNGAGAQPMTFTISLDKLSGKPVDISYSTSEVLAGFKATSGIDFTATQGTITIPAGSLSVTVDVPIVQDAIFENDETFEVNLSAPVNANLGIATGTGTIVNDDSVPVLAFLPPASVFAEPDLTTGQEQHVITVTGSGQTELPITFIYSFANGTATNGVDYSGITDTITFIPPALTDTYTFDIPVDILADDIKEQMETFNISLSSPINATIPTATAEKTASITDVTAAPEVTLSVDKTSVFEGESASVTASLSRSTYEDVTVTYTVRGTATEGTDYTIAKTITIPAGALSASVFLNSLTDNIHEQNETIIIDAPVTVVGGEAIANATQQSLTITIADQTSSPIVTIQFDKTSVNEGDAAVLTLSLSNPTFEDVVISLNLAGTAINPNDYSADATSVTIPVGQINASVNFISVVDNLVEPNETVLVSIGAVTGGDATYQGTQTQLLSIVNTDIGTQTANNAVTTTEDIAYQFVLSDFPFTATVLRMFDHITILKLPILGSLTLSGVPVVINQQILATDIVNLTYLPNSDLFGTPLDVIGFTVTDNFNNESAAALLAINVTPVNDPPVASTPLSFVIDEDISLEGHLLATDADGDALTFSKTTDPANGTVTLNADGSFTYLPNPNYNGTDTFTATVSDGNGGTALITVNISINPVNDA
ncbi:Ig-like domain-containing protein, partial [Solitalea sp. MAHUQ-68]